MSDQPTKTVPFGPIRLDEETREHVQAIAAAHHEGNISAALRRIIREHKLFSAPTLDFSEVCTDTKEAA